MSGPEAQSAVTVAEILVELRRQLHRSALLRHCMDTLRAGFLEEGAPPAYQLHIGDQGPEGVDEDVLIDVEVEIGELASRAQAEVESILRRVVTMDVGGPPGGDQMTAKVVRNPERGGK